MTTERSGPGASTAPRLRSRFGPEPIALFPLSLALLGTVPVAGTTPWLAWLPVLPLLAAVWVLRARVQVRPSFLVVCNGLRRRLVRWDEVEGFDVPRRGPVRLLHPGRRTALTALPRRELPQLLAAAEQVAGPGSGRTGPAPG